MKIQTTIRLTVNPPHFFVHTSNDIIDILVYFAITTSFLRVLK